MRGQDVQWCEESGVDVLGFVVEYPREVPWNLTRTQAATLIATAKRPTCIVTGGAPESVITLAGELKPDMVQLHYRETVAQTAEIATTLKKSGIQTIRAVYDETDIRALCETDIDAILVDSRTSENAANSSQTVDIDLFLRIKAQADKPLVIGGGITPDNVNDVIARTRANWIDVMTSVEHLPGVKDKMKIEALVRNARNSSWQH